MRVYLSILFFFSVLLFVQVPDMNNPEKYPYGVNKWFVDSLNNQPIEYYLNHPQIDEYGKLFYLGKFSISDDTLTFAFLDSVLTTNESTRNFYMFIFNSVLRITDGALSEYIGVDCRAFLEKYPCEFIKLKNHELHSDNYQKWIDFASYEYFFEDKPIKVINQEFERIFTLVSKSCEIEFLDELEHIKLKLIESIEENQN